MEIVHSTKFDIGQGKAKPRDARIVIGYASVAIALLIAICLGSFSPGTGPGDFATMTVFP
jgi:hypothetical protein